MLAEPPAQKQFGGRGSRSNGVPAAGNDEVSSGPFDITKSAKKKTKKDTENEKTDLPATGGGAELPDPLEFFNRRLLPLSWVCGYAVQPGVCGYTAEPGSTVVVVESEKGLIL